jgi:hypothetical protein
MLLIYTPFLTPRIQYVFELVFVQLLGVEMNSTCDEQALKHYTGAKLSYADAPLGNEIFFKRSSLLLEKEIKPINHLPEDVFALIFFLITRYEEYLPFEGDEHGRYPSTLSLLAKNNLLHKPVINLKAAEIKQQLKNKYPLFIFPEKKFTCTPTLDIDNAYAFKGKHFLVHAAAFLQSVLKLTTPEAVKRAAVLLGKMADPFDTYALQFSIHKKYALNPIYFFLLADRARFDKNLPPQQKLMQALIKKISGNYEVGIHPSYQSNAHPPKIRIEKNRLEQASVKKIVSSRQHFLLLTFPDTYRNLLHAGITHDYSMGYADDIGFRAGICTPFYWYDLAKDEKTTLRVHPFCFMDGTLRHYLKLTPNQALEQARQLIAEVKAVNGNFSFIWHNETFSNWREWQGWRTMYEEIVKISLGYL